MDVFTILQITTTQKQEAVARRCFVKRNSQENTCAGVSVLIKVQVCNFVRKETLTLVFSYEFYEIFNKTFSL